MECLYVYGTVCVYFGPQVYIPSNTCIFWTSLLNVALISDCTFSKVSMMQSSGF